MHIRLMPFACMRRVCSNEPSTTSALPPIRFCSAAVPDANAVDSTSRPSCWKYFRFSATKYATLFIWLIEPPTESAMRVFSSLGGCASAGPTNMSALAIARQPIRFIPSSQNFLEVCQAARVATSSALARRSCRQHAHATLHLGRDVIIAHELPRIAQAKRLALHHEHPQRVPGVCDERAALLLALS